MATQIPTSQIGAAISLISTLQLEHLPASHEIHIALYRNISNASYIHQQLLAGNTDFEYALIDASVVVSKIHALAATYRAVNDLLEDRLKSRNVHSEIVFSLSPNNNIAESFRRFGITPSTTNLLIIKISTPSSPVTAQDMQAHLDKEFQGEQLAFQDEVLDEIVDVTRVRKVYKLNAVGGGGGGGKKVVNGMNGVSMEKEREERKELEALVLGCIVLRGANN